MALEVASFFLAGLAGLADLAGLAGLAGLADFEDVAGFEAVAVSFLDAAALVAIGFVTAVLLFAGVLAVDFLDGDDAEFATDRAKGNLNE